MDEKKLLKFAIDYLSKYDSSKKNLAYILKRKIFRLKISSFEKNKLINTLDEIILKLEKNNFINDSRFAMSKINYLSKSGKSKNYIINYLLKKGVNKLEINSNLEILNQENKEWELDSAKIFLLKKKILESEDSYEKKIAKLSRAGFKYEICKKLLS